MKHLKKSKQFFTALIAVAMVFSSLSITAFAADADVPTSYNNTLNSTGALRVSFATSWSTWLTAAKTGTVTVDGATYTHSSSNPTSTGTYKVYTSTSSAASNYISFYVPAGQTQIAVVNASGYKTFTMAIQSSAASIINGLALSAESLALSAGDTQALSATVTQTGSWDLSSKIEWASSDSSVATVSGGIVCAVGAGSADITATLGGYTASCTVTVGAASSYTVAVASTENGSISADRESASEGETVKLTVAADKDYELKTLSVTDTDGNEVSLTDNGGGTYSFTMPASNVTVHVTFTKAYKYSWYVYVWNEKSESDGMAQQEYCETKQTSEDSTVTVTIPDTVSTDNVTINGVEYAFAGWVVKDGIYLHTMFTTDNTESYFTGNDITLDLTAGTNFVICGVYQAVGKWYNIIITDTENGTVAADKQTAGKGETVTFTVTPDNGYALKSLTVTGENVSAVRMTKNADGTYSFTMPAYERTASDITISAAFAPAIEYDAEIGVNENADNGYMYTAYLCYHANYPDGADETYTVKVTYHTAGAESNKGCLVALAGYADAGFETPDGYAFAGWGLAGAEQAIEKQNITVGNAGKVINLYAIYAPATHTVIVDGADVSDTAAFSSFEEIDLTDTTVFKNGENDAYLVTIDGETRLVGDTTLKKWAGTWEDWQQWIYPDEEMLEKYPYLEEVWDLAYEAYIAAFEAVGFGDMMRALYPDTAALKAYWYNMTDTKGVGSITVTGSTEAGYLMQWLDENGNVLAEDSYTMTGKMMNGLESAVMYIFTADHLTADSKYKYFVAMQPDMEGDETCPIAAHYHFQFGSDLEALLNYGELYNGTDKNISDKYWYATMINADASDLAKYNVILGMHQAEKWSSLPNETMPEEKYTVTIPGTENGTVSASSETGKEGERITLAVSPADGYALGALSVTDADGNEVRLTDNGDGTYSFTMPASNVSVNAMFTATNSGGSNGSGSNASGSNGAGNNASGGNGSGGNASGSNASGSNSSGGTTSTDSPKTGDEMNLTVWVSLIGLALAGMAGTGIACKRRRYTEKHTGK